MVIFVPKNKTFPWSIFLEVKIQNIMICASLLNTAKLISKSPWIPSYEPKLEWHWNFIEFMQSFRGRGIILYNKCSHWRTLFYLHLGLFSISFIMFFVNITFFLIFPPILYRFHCYHEGCFFLLYYVFWLLLKEHNETSLVDY